MAIHDENKSQPSGGLAIGSLVTGIAAVFACGLGLILGPVAVVLGIVSGRRGRFGSKETAGIATGILGFLISAGALVWLFVYAADDDDRTITTPTPAPASATAADDGETSSPTAAGGFPLTEAGVAGAGFDTAYAAYLDTFGVTDAMGGIYQGDAIDTPCFSMEGEAWWITQGTPETCDPSSELWWETYSDKPEDEIKLFGSGGAGSGISFEAVPLDYLAENVGGTDLASFAAFVKDQLIVPSGPTDIVQTDTTLDGAPAVQFDCTFDGLEAYRVYVVLTPDEYAVEGDRVGAFIVHAFNEAEWVYKSDDVFARLENTLKWK